MRSETTLPAKGIIRRKSPDLDIMQLRSIYAFKFEHLGIKINSKLLYDITILNAKIYWLARVVLIWKEIQYT